MPESQSEPEPPSKSSPANRDSASNLSQMNWHLLFEPGTESVPEELTENFITRCCEATLNQQSLLELSGVSDLELSVQLLDVEAMRALNLQYRQMGKSTNVLSFASEMPLMVADREAGSTAEPGGLLVLGDLVLCPAVISREAADQGKSPLQHWVHMLVHGSLHLCGYDHEEDDDAQVMEAMEIRILSGLGISDPYAVTNAVNKQ